MTDYLHDNPDFQRWVQSVVHYNVSALVSILASGYGAASVEGYEEHSLEDLCEQAFKLCRPILDNIDPLDAGYEQEVYEHWIVDRWLVNQLAENGCRFDRDFAGLCVWGRTETGQSLTMDADLQRVYLEWQRQFP